MIYIEPITNNTNQSIIIMDIATVSRVMIMAALLMQLMHLMQKNKTIYSPAFLVYSLGAYLMTYDYYTIDGAFSSRVLFKLFNSTVLFLIYAFSK